MLNLKFKKFNEWIIKIKINKLSKIKVIWINEKIEIINYKSIINKTVKNCF